MAEKKTVWSAFDAQDLKQMKKLLKDGADLSVPLFEGGDTPLHFALERGWLEGAKALIKAGVPVEAKSGRGDSALMWACINRTDARPRLVELLLDAGADIETTNALGMTPLLYTTRLGAGYDVTMTATSEEDGVTTTREIGPEEVRASYLDVIRLLIARGAKVNAQDPSGKTALYYAVDAGNAAFVTALLEAGANARLGDSGGLQPLHRASERGDVQCTRLLLEHGAAASAADADGFTPLHLAAAFSGNVDVVRLLLEHGADRQARIGKGWKDIAAGMTPADVASLRQRAEMLEALR